MKFFYWNERFSSSTITQAARQHIFQIVHIVCVAVDYPDINFPLYTVTVPGPTFFVVEVDSASHLSLRNCRMPPRHPASCTSSTVFFIDYKVGKLGSSSTSDAIPSCPFPIRASLVTFCDCKKKCLFQSPITGSKIITNKPLSQRIGSGGARNIRVGEYNSLYTAQCLEIGKGGGGSIIGGGGPTGHWQHLGPNAKKNVF